MYNVVYSTLYYLFNVGNVLQCIIYPLNLSYLCMLHKYHVIHSIQYYPQFHVTVVCRGTYYLWIWGPYCMSKWMTLYEIWSRVSTGSFSTPMPSFSRRFSCKYLFLYVCPGVNYQYLWASLLLQSFMVCLAVPSQTRGHINGCSHPGTANCMEASFPSISLWPDTYTSYNMQCSANFLSEWWQSQMN
jgi:hypothetical protein